MFLISKSINFYDKYTEYTKSYKYISSYKDPALQIAQLDLQQNFNSAILRYNIKINNQKISYNLLEDNEDVIEANYSLSLQGDYLALLKYLDYLNEHKMLYKIDKLNLSIKKDLSLQILLNLRSLYEEN